MVGAGGTWRAAAEPPPPPLGAGRQASRRAGAAAAAPEVLARCGLGLAGTQVQRMQVERFVQQVWRRRSDGTQQQTETVQVPPAGGRQRLAGVWCRLGRQPAAPPCTCGAAGAGARAAGQWLALLCSGRALAGRWVLAWGPL